MQSAPGCSQDASQPDAQGKSLAWRDEQVGMGRGNAPSASLCASLPKARSAPGTQHTCRSRNPGSAARRASASPLTSQWLVLAVRPSVGSRSRSPVHASGHLPGTCPAAVPPVQAPRRSASQVAQPAEGGGRGAGPADLPVISDLSASATIPPQPWRGCWPALHRPAGTAAPAWTELSRLA